MGEKFSPRHRHRCKDCVYGDRNMLWKDGSSKGSFSKLLQYLILTMLRFVDGILSFIFGKNSLYYLCLYGLIENFFDLIFGELRHKKFDTDSSNNQESRERDSTKYKDGLVPSPSSLFLQKCMECFDCFVEDATGVDLLQKFLDRENSETTVLKFFFASRGLKRINPTDKAKMIKAVNLIYERLAKRSCAISPSTKYEIEKKLRYNTGVDIHIFDMAQGEVKEYVLTTIFPIFLNSDLFHQYLDKIDRDNRTKRERWSNNTNATLQTVLSLKDFHMYKTICAALNKYRGKSRFRNAPQLARTISPISEEKEIL